jgi:hypothetical protein
MMAGMSVTELAKMATKLKMVEDRRGISSIEGAEWEALLQKRLKTLDEKERDEFKGTAAIVSNPQNFYNSGGGGLALVRASSKDESTSQQGISQSSE